MTSSENQDQSRLVTRKSSMMFEEDKEDCSKKCQEYTHNSYIEKFEKHFNICIDLEIPLSDTAVEYADECSSLKMLFSPIVEPSSNFNPATEYKFNKLISLNCAKITVEFKDGSYYTGQLGNNIFDGNGMYVYSENDPQKRKFYEDNIGKSIK